MTSKGRLHQEKSRSSLTDRNKIYNLEVRHSRCVLRRNVESECEKQS